jgi:hypothetical protein
MFYSTRHFFRLAGLLLAAYITYQRLPDMLRGLKSAWTHLNRFFSAHALDAAVALLHDALHWVLPGTH